MKENESGLTVTADKILVRPDKVEEKSSGGILIASVTKDREEMAQIRGTIIDMGQTAHLCPEMKGIEIGDSVLHARYAGAEFPVNGIRYRILRAVDVLGRADRAPDSVLRGAQSSAEIFGVNQVAA